MDVFLNFDMGILNWIQRYCRNAVADAVFPALGGLGDMGVLWVLCAVAMLCMGRTRRYGVLLLIALAAAGGLHELLQPLVNRPRPYMDPARMLVLPIQGASFPSGHALTSFASAAVFWYYDRRWGIGAMLIAALIGFARLFLFVHYPTDVFAGLTMGLLIGFGVCLFDSKVMASVGRRKG
jgi:undecaprenyl-diphosphatase